MCCICACENGETSTILHAVHPFSCFLPSFINFLSFHARICTGHQRYTAAAATEPTLGLPTQVRWPLFAPIEGSGGAACRGVRRIGRADGIKRLKKRDKSIVQEEGYCLPLTCVKQLVSNFNCIRLDVNMRSPFLISPRLDLRRLCNSACTPSTR